MDTLKKVDPPICKVNILTANPTSYQITHFPCIMGRSEECDLTVDNPSISQRHAEFSLIDGNKIQITDLGSTNGIYIGSRRVIQLIIDQAKKLLFGKLEIEFVPTGSAYQSINDSLSEDMLNNPDDGYFYRRDGKKFGPYSQEQLIHLASEGVILDTDYIWEDGATAWVRAEFLPDLFINVSANQDAKENNDEPASAMKVAKAVAISAIDKKEKNNATISRVLERISKHRYDYIGDIDESKIIICPHCWHKFAIEDFLFIARHQSLIGDSVLGEEAQQRFFPSRFTPEGNAIDSAGTSCPDMACPHCHLRIPKPATEMPPLFISVVGATASGKSYFLTSMLWELRNALARNFAISFTDADAINNQIVNEFEETLFLNSEADELVALRKTELQGELYNQVMLDGMIINLPKPFMFSITPAEHHPHYRDVCHKMSRTLVLYDNAGEHFEPGMDLVDNPTTQHLLHSDIIFFIFDPTKDVRFRNRLKGVNDPQLFKGARVQRQETILTEMINRIKKYSGMRTSAKSAKTLILIVAKCDVWQQLLTQKLTSDPWKWDIDLNTCVLDTNTIKNVSFNIRALLEDICPEVVSTAESFAGEVIYLPNSALGHSPELSEDTGMIGVRPENINPIWGSVPMLYFFNERGFIPTMRPQMHQPVETVEIHCQFSGDIAFVMLPNQEKPLQIPISYSGCTLQCPKTGMWFKMPEYLNKK